MSDAPKARTHIVDFDFPLKVGSTEVSRLEFRRAKGSDVETFDNTKGDAAKVLKMIERLASNPDDPDMPITPKLVREIDAADIEKIAVELDDFLQLGRRTGANA